MTTLVLVNFHFQSPLYNVWRTQMPYRVKDNHKPSKQAFFVQHC